MQWIIIIFFPQVLKPVSLQGGARIPASYRGPQRLFFRCLDLFEKLGFRLDRREMTSPGDDQSWKMSNLLHGPISTNQILPREKRVTRNIFGTSNLQNKTYGVSCGE